MLSTFRRQCFLLSLPVLMLTAQTAIAHEYWIEPRIFTAIPGETIEADLKNGQHFKGSNLYFLTHRFKRFEVHTPQGIEKITGNEGDQPALKFKTDNSGLHVLVYESIFDNLTFETWEKFENYLRSEGLEDVIERHRARELPQTHFTERYSRRAKSLVKIGDGKGTDRLTGLGFEFVAQQNPYALADASGDNRALRVRLYLNDKPHKNQAINVFQDNGKVHENQVRTDAEGFADVPISGGGKIMLSAVYMFDGDDDDTTELPEWQSLWANLTFELPISDGNIAK